MTCCLSFGAEDQERGQGSPQLNQAGAVGMEVWEHEQMPKVKYSENIIFLPIMNFKGRKL